MNFVEVGFQKQRVDCIHLPATFFLAGEAPRRFPALHSLLCDVQTWADKAVSWMKIWD